MQTTRNIILALVAIGIFVIAAIMYTGCSRTEKSKTSTGKEFTSVASAEAYAISLEDTLTAWKQAYNYCATGAGYTAGERKITVPPPTRKKCNFCPKDQPLSVELLQHYIWDLQDSIVGYKAALNDCMSGKKHHQPVIRHRTYRNNPCPPCPPVSSANNPPTTYVPPQNPAPQTVEDDLAPEMRALLNQGSNPISTPGEPVNLAEYVGYREGPFCVTISADGYPQFCVTDQIFRLSNPTITAPRHATAQGGEYHLESDGYWVYTDKTKGLVTMDNLLNQIQMWSMFTGINPEWNYPMFIPHELVKKDGLLQYKEKPGAPSIHPNGIKYGDDLTAPDKNQGWRFHAKFLYRKR
ncbi:MAG: hypothetical protein WC441_02205 [Patescibacteria group bacterium]